MASWQRRARVGFGVFALVLVAVILFNLRPRERPVATPKVDRLDPKASVETRGGQVVRLSGERQDIRIEFEGQVTYDDGQSKLLGVKAYIDNRNGRSFTISGREGQVGPDQSSIDVVGDAVLSTSDGLTTKSNEAHYLKSEGIVRAPGPVQFQRGRMSGSGVGFTYDEQRNILALLDRAQVYFAPEGDLTEMRVASGAWTFARTDRYMHFERGMTLVREGQTIRADDATAHLLADRDEPDMIELRGNSSIVGGTGAGSLQNMRARDINLDYAEDGKTLQHVVLAGRGQIVLANRDGSLGQTLDGEFIDVVMAPDGAVTSLTARDRARVALPASGDAPGRVIAAPSLTGTGAAGQGLTGMHFDGGVDFREAASATSQPRAAKARTLDVQLAPATGLLQDARFNGQFRFEEGSTVATSAQARYDVAKGHLSLAGGDAGRQPQLEDERLVIKATDIDVTLSPRRIDGNGRVTTQMLPAKDDSSRGPSLLDGKQAAFASADKVTFDEASGLSTYTGQARLWQGDTTIRADTISMSDKQGDMSAKGKVTTALALVQEPAGQPAKAAQGGAAPAAAAPTIARGEEFAYEEATRRATYTTGAQMNGPDGAMRGDRIRLHLEANENALKQVDADGSVIVNVESRQATGVKLTYLPTDASYLMHGAPVKLLEGCRETTGKTLTFYRGSDRILVDGNQQQRTETKGGGKCPEPRFH